MIELEFHVIWIEKSLALRREVKSLVLWWNSRGRLGVPYDDMRLFEMFEQCVKVV